MCLRVSLYGHDKLNFVKLYTEDYIVLKGANRGLKNVITSYKCILSEDMAYGN